MASPKLDNLVGISGKEDTVGPLEDFGIVQSLEHFDWNALSGDYRNIISSKKVKAQVSGYNRSKAIDFVTPISLGENTATFTAEGTLSYDRNELRKETGHEEPVEEFLKVKPGAFVQADSKKIDLGGLTLGFSERIFSFGRRYDPNSDQKSLEVSFVDKDGHEKLSFLYVESLSEKKLVDSDMYMKSDDKLTRLNPEQNKDLFGIMMSIDFCHTKLKRESPEINDYSIKGEAS